MMAAQISLPSTARAVGVEAPFRLSPQSTLNPLELESPQQTESPHRTDSSVAVTARRENTKVPKSTESPQRTESPQVMLKLRMIPVFCVTGSYMALGERAGRRARS